MSSIEGGLSLWLSPQGDEFEKIRDLIKTLADENDGCLDFEPHVTLISDDQTVSEAVKDWNHSVGTDHLTGDGLEKGLEIKFNMVEFGSKFYQCVYVSIVKSDQLLRLNGILRASLIKDLPSISIPDYYPHLSLIYSNMYNVDKKLEICERSKGLIESIKSFRTPEILLVKTMGKSTDWKKLGSVKFSDGSFEIF
ncbi:2',3'-cyclic-nucleotide 3'-phosphodiesterase [Phakopsora pachyrhizi]|uniref:2',3'-cyclic-nucleotide 3'-phosphodiesterase n=1 Tax=Phakopsora pachyrhizi TaxID=170000 RepID=A0AAV0BH80_PHAPC|nr:2',3'-cyclic-nucleotide 3'-phosphodiesterase [Phakopsora pachyrhizi]